MNTRAAVDGTIANIHFFAFDLYLWGQCHTKCCPVPSTSCHLDAQAMFEVATCYGLGDAFTRKYIIPVWPWGWGQGHTNVCPVFSTSYDLQSLKLLRHYMERLRRISIYKKIPYKTLSWKLCTCNVWSCFLQMHVYKKNTEFCPIPSTSCDLWSLQNKSQLKTLKMSIICNHNQIDWGCP